MRRWPWRPATGSPGSPGREHRPSTDAVRRSRPESTQRKVRLMSSIAPAAAEDLGGGPRSTGIAPHPLLCFSILTLVLSWLAVIPYALGVFPVPLLPCSPFLAAIITAA